MSGTPYTFEDLRFIRKWAGIKTTTEIAGYLGRTRAGVAQFARSKGINLKQVGQYHYNAKLTDKQVDELLTLHGCGYTPKQLHDHLPHVTIKTIYDILECNTWRHK
jgi:hypothetical protein